MEDELRLKSNEDLHKLWLVTLLKIFRMLKNYSYIKVCIIERKKYDYDDGG